MRVIWILAGIAGASAVAVASPNAQFYTVINQGDAIAGDQFAAPEVVVVGDGGVVATVGQLENSGNNVIIYSTPTSNNQWSSQTVIEDNTDTNVIGLGDNQQFYSYSNVGLTGDSSAAQLTFYTESATNSNAGILQWDSDSNTITNIAFAGDISPQFDVNSSAQVLFSTSAMLARGNGVATTPLVTYSGSLSGLPSGQPDLALGTDNSAIEELDSSGTDGIYKINATGGVVTPPLAGSPNFALDAEPIIGYASGNGLNSYALTVVNGSTSGKLDIDLSKNLGAAQPILSNQFTTSSNNYYAPSGEMTPNGQIAVYVPDDNGAGDTIQYLNAASGNTTASVIAAVGTVARDPTGSNLIIQSLQQQVFAGPEINSGGTIVFAAEVGTSPSDEKQAILDWLPGDASPEIVLADGDTVDIDGVAATIDGLIVDQSNPQDEIYFNSLSDDNYLGLAVQYTYDAGPDDGDSGTAVIITQLVTEVPEPATMALLPMIGVGLLARRKRQH